MGKDYDPQASKGFKINFSKSGNGYLSGWFNTFASFPCKTLISSGDDDVFITIVNPPPSTIDTSICRIMLSPSTRYTWDSSGLYYDTIPNHLGCDSVLLFRLTLLQSDTMLDSAVCRSMVSFSGKYTWDSLGTYLDTIPNHNGCDSVITLHLKILQTQSIIDSIVTIKLVSPSGKFIWDSSGIYHDTIPNRRGCDSLITIRLIVLQSQSSIDTAVCNRYVSPSGKYILDSSAVLRDTIPNSMGADSIMTIRLTILQTRSTIDTSICKKLMSPSGKYIWDSAGTFMDTIPNSNGCDSIITVRLKTLQTQSNIDTSSCSIYLSPSGRYSFDSTGIYVDTILNKNNCDSIITIRYTRASASPSAIIAYTCDSLLSPSKKYYYSTSGTYTDTIPSSGGCDSILRIQLTVVPLHVSLSKSNDLSCDSPYAQLSVSGGNSYMWHPSDGLSSPSIANPIVKVDTKTTFTVLVGDTLGCSISDSIVLLVNKTEHIQALPNVFTPNNDGINDCLNIESLGQLKLIEFKVFNRWGALVFETSNPQACWNGKDQQETNLAAGNYYFILTGTSDCDTPIEQHGSILLIR
jgi:gliding motility-associated-like protein